MKIKLTKGYFAEIDIEDIILTSQYTWQYKGGYAQGSTKMINGKRYKAYLHRLVMNAKKGQEIDHINRNRLDNRKTNLRFCTSSQNKTNSVRRSIWQYRGVTKVKNRFCAYIGSGIKRKSLGCYSTPEQAAKAYDIKAKEIYGEFSSLNFP